MPCWGWVTAASKNTTRPPEENVAAENKAAIDAILNEYSLINTKNALTIPSHASHRLRGTSDLPAGHGGSTTLSIPELIGKVEMLLEKHVLKQGEINVRMSGCPNGCSRPYVAEIGLIGRIGGALRFAAGRRSFRLPPQHHVQGRIGQSRNIGYTRWFVDRLQARTRCG
jgi:sulfite reductase beta subunit-like hemoprotein